MIDKIIDLLKANESDLAIHLIYSQNLDIDEIADRILDLMPFIKVKDLEELSFAKSVNKHILSESHGGKKYQIYNTLVLKNYNIIICVRGYYDKPYADFSFAYRNCLIYPINEFKFIRLLSIHLEWFLNFNFKIININKKLPGKFIGTLKSEIEKTRNRFKNQFKKIIESKYKSLTTYE